ncbi:putative inactive receptor kinase [Acorus calamus]|uniref:Inactive receptor kinase n=1 Tax=Acorus calamus TaxID=4465 RepID=A0AAV9CR60_ACOCL|nr:putative inactive receptor kinase [Acorus calamus]
MMFHRYMNKKPPQEAPQEINIHEPLEPPRVGGRWKGSFDGGGGRNEKTLLSTSKSLDDVSQNKLPDPSSQDINALLSFQSSSDPFNHSLVSWSQSSNPCNSSWLGVTCKADRVVHLVLENLGLVGHIDALTKLDQLRLLSLKNNNLSSNIATLNLSSWKDLKLLYLSNNHLHGQLPNEIGCLRRLHRLDLSGNRLSGVIPVALGRLTRLVTLRLEHNSFSGTLQPLSGLSSISDFNVSENALSGEIPESLSTFPPSAFGGNRGLSRKPNQTAIKRSMGE